MKILTQIGALTVLSLTLAGCDMQSICEALGQSAFTCALLF